MKIIDKALPLAVLLASLGAGLVWAQQTESERVQQRIEDVDQQMAELEREHADKRRALKQEYKEKRRELVESEQFKSMDRGDRRARVKELKAQYKAERARLNDEFKAKRAEFDDRRERIEEAGEYR